MAKNKCDYKTYLKGVKKITKWVEQNNFNFDGVYGIPRGGLPLAVHLSYLLELPLLLAPTIDSLVVDDIADTGKTLENIKNKKIATLYYHKQSIVVPDKWVFKKKDNWIVYWWEV